MRWLRENWFKILFNLIAIFLIFLCAEYILYFGFDQKTKARNKDIRIPFWVYPSDLNRILSPTIDQDFHYLNADYYHIPADKSKDLRAVWFINFRDPVGLNYKKKPVLLFGCSFAWGLRLDENQSFYYKLSHITKRPVYNRSLASWGLQHMLYQLRQEDFYSMVPKPEFVVYLYISNHISRMHKYNFLIEHAEPYNYNFLKYNERNGKLYEEKRMQHVPYSRILNWCIYSYIARMKEKSAKVSFNLLRLHLLECRKEIDKHWGKDVKFIVFDYETTYLYPFEDVLADEKNIQKLKEDGIYVIKSSELTDANLDSLEYFINKNDHHPNEKVWDLLTPLFAKKAQELGL